MSRGDVRAKIKRGRAVLYKIRTRVLASNRQSGGLSFIFTRDRSLECSRGSPGFLSRQFIMPTNTLVELDLNRAEVAVRKTSR